MSDKETTPNLKLVEGGRQDTATAPEVAVDDLSAASAPTEMAVAISGARRSWELGRDGADIGAQVLKNFVFDAAATTAAARMMESPVARDTMLPRSAFMSPAFESLRTAAVRAVVQGAEELGVAVGAGTRQLLAA